jgi:hypothetical protein
MRRWIALLVTFVPINAAESQDWARADQATRRLAPSAFVRLPAAVRAELERRGCTIPQPFSATQPANVITGRFTSTAGTDWAVLCSRQRTSSILVFRGGSASAVAEIASHPDINFLQAIGGGVIGYSRALGVADAKYIQDHHERYGGPKPPPLDHEGINDIFVEKGSSVWYWHRGHWLKFAGAD